MSESNSSHVWKTTRLIISNVRRWRWQMSRKLYFQWMFNERRLFLLIRINAWFLAKYIKAFAFIPNYLFVQVYSMLWILLAHSLPSALTNMGPHPPPSWPSPPKFSSLHRFDLKMVGKIQCKLKIVSQKWSFPSMHN